MAWPRGSSIRCFLLITILSAVPGGLATRASAPTDTDRATIEHVLARVTFGARPGDVARVGAMGLSAYIEQQLRPDDIDDSGLEARLAAFETLTMSSRELAEKYFLPALEMRRTRQQQGEAQRGMMVPARDVLQELTQARLLRATFSERQLQEVLTDFWFNHFNVFAGKGQVRQYLTAYERDAIRPHVLGNFRTLLGAVAHSPAMLFYLDNFQSAAPNARLALRGNAPRGLNENYARELMELHTLGVDGGYTQQDVTELARILTGWTIDQPRLGGEFLFRPMMHDAGTKTFLGATFRAEGEREGERALDMLAAHRSTARHLAFRLAQRFVADEPPPALVERAAAVFTNTHGNLTAVTRTILMSPELLAADVRRANVKTPLEFVVSAVRVTGATVRTAQPLVMAVRTLGMGLYECQPPTGYRTTADAWVNTGALLNRMNVAVQLVSDGRVVPAERAGRGTGTPEGGTSGLDPRGGRRGGTSEGARAMRPIAIDVASLAPDTGPAAQDAVVDRLLGGVASDATRRALARADTPEQLIALALGSPEFQRH